MLNRVCLIGRTTKDSELRYSNSGTAITNFTLAVERNYKNSEGKRDADFIPCVAYRQLAEFAANYTPKGNMTCVEGHIQVRSYTTDDGQKRYVTEIIADNIYPFLGSKDSSQTQSQQNQSYGHEVDEEAPF